jgi:osmotically-inducible protein OsmY
VARGHCSINAFILSVVAAFAITGTAACQNTARGLKQDARQAEEQTRDERAEAKDKARDVIDDVARAANNAGEEAAERAGAAWETLDVKGALMADPSVDAARIDVDTNYRTKTVTLNGYVPTETERNMAEVIAKARAEGYAVVNNLQVRPRR